MMSKIDQIATDLKNDLIEFAQQLVQTKSYSGQEGDVIRFIEAKMNELGYDEVIIDGMGNVLGRIGDGEQTILFDSHVDTVAVNDEALWDTPPFEGRVKDGYLHGRGSVDMKSSAAASIYSGVIAKKLGLDDGKTIYVSCTVFEEDCDGENLKHLFKEQAIRPDYVVICEPSSNTISLGHKGKAQVVIKTHGVSAHGAAPEKGKNAIYEMAEIIQRVEQTNLELMKNEKPRGTLVMSQISSSSASLNAVPAGCEVYLDRRTVPSETDAMIKQEMGKIIEGKEATWEVGTLHRTSWTGMEIKYDPFHPAWEISLDHELTKACIAAFQETFGSSPSTYKFWDFSTNAVTPVSYGIPTIGFGPGDSKMAHMVNERCEIEQIFDACRFYAHVCQIL